jgi:hypothetical protein
VFRHFSIKKTALSPRERAVDSSLGKENVESPEGGHKGRDYDAIPLQNIRIALPISHCPLPTAFFSTKEGALAASVDY